MPLLPKGGDVVLLLRALVVQLVLSGVDDHHAVLDGLHDVTLGGPFQCHIGDEVRDLPHLYLGGLFGEEPDTGLAFGGVFNFGVEVLQPSKGGGRFYVHPPTGRDDNDLVTIEVRSREPLRNLGVDTNGVPCPGTQNRNS